FHAPTNTPIGVSALRVSSRQQPPLFSCYGLNSMPNYREITGLTATIDARCLTFFGSVHQARQAAQRNAPQNARQQRPLNPKQIRSDVMPRVGVGSFGALGFSTVEMPPARQSWDKPLDIVFH